MDTYLLSGFLNKEQIEKSLVGLERSALYWSFFPKVEIRETPTTSTKTKKVYFIFTFSVKKNDINLNMSDIYNIHFITVENPTDNPVQKENRIFLEWTNDGIKSNVIEERNVIDNIVILKNRTNYNVRLNYIHESHNTAKSAAYTSEYNVENNTTIFKSIRVNLYNTRVTNYAEHGLYWQKKDIGGSDYRKWIQKRMLPHHLKYEMLSWYTKSSLDVLVDDFYAASMTKLSIKDRKGYHLLSERSFVTVLKLGKSLDIAVTSKNSLIPNKNYKRYLVNLIDSFNERKLLKKRTIYANHEDEDVYYYQPSNYDIFFESVKNDKDVKTALLELFLDGDDISDAEIKELLSYGTSLHSFDKIKAHIRTVLGKMEVRTGDVMREGIEKLFESVDVKVVYEKWEKKGQGSQEIYSETFVKFELTFNEVLRETIKSGLLIWCSHTVNKATKNLTEKEVNMFSIGAWYSAMAWCLKLIESPDDFGLNSIFQNISKTDITANTGATTLSDVIKVKLLDSYRKLRMYFIKISCIIALDSKLFNLDCFEIIFSKMSSQLINNTKKSKLVNELLYNLDGVSKLTQEEEESGNAPHLYKNGSIIIKACKQHKSTRFDGIEIGSPIRRTFNEVKRMANAKQGWSPYRLNVSEDILKKTNPFQEHPHGLESLDYLINEPSEYIILNGSPVTRENIMRESENRAYDLIESGYKTTVYVRAFPLLNSTLSINYDDLRSKMAPTIRDEVKRLKRKLLNHMQNKGSKASIVKEGVSNNLGGKKELKPKTSLMKRLKKLYYFQMLLDSKVTGTSHWRVEWHKGLTYKGRKSFISIGDLNLIFYRTYPAENNERSTPHSNELYNTGVYTAWLVNVEDLKKNSPMITNMDAHESFSILLDKINNTYIKTKKLAQGHEDNLKIEAIYQKRIREYNERLDKDVLFISPDFDCPTIARMATINILPSTLESKTPASWDFVQNNLVSSENSVDFRSDYKDGDDITGLPVKISENQKTNDILLAESIFANTHLKKTLDIQSFKKNFVVDRYVTKEDFVVDNLMYEDGETHNIYNTATTSYWDGPKSVAEAWMTSPYIWNFSIPVDKASESIYKNPGTIQRTTLNLKPFLKNNSNVGIDLMHLDPLLMWAMKRKLNQQRALWANRKIIDFDLITFKKRFLEPSLNKFTREYVSNKMYQKNKTRTRNARSLLGVNDLTTVVGNSFHNANVVWSILRLLDSQTTGGGAKIFERSVNIFAPLSDVIGFGSPSLRRYLGFTGIHSQIKLHLDFVKRLVSPFFDARYPWISSLQYKHLFNNFGSSDLVDGGFLLKYQLNVHPPLTKLGDKIEEMDNKDAFIDVIDIFVATISKEWLKKAIKYIRMIDDNGLVEIPPLMTILRALRTHCLKRMKEVSKKDVNDPNDPIYIPKQLTVHMRAPIDEDVKREIEKKFSKQPEVIKYIDVLYYKFMDQITDNNKFKDFGNVDTSDYNNFDEMVSEYALATSVAMYEITKIGSNYKLNLKDKNSILKDKLDFNEQNAMDNFTEVVVLEKGRYDNVHYTKDILVKVYAKCLDLIEDVKKVAKVLTTNSSIKAEFKNDLSRMSPNEGIELLDLYKEWKPFKNDSEKKSFDKEYWKILNDIHKGQTLGSFEWSNSTLELLMVATIETMSSEEYSEQLLYYSQSLYNTTVKANTLWDTDPYVYTPTYRVGDTRRSNIGGFGNMAERRYKVPHHFKKNVPFELLQVALNPGFNTNDPKKNIRLEGACKIIDYLMNGDGDFYSLINWDCIYISNVDEDTGFLSKEIHKRGELFQDRFESWISRNHPLSNMNSPGSEHGDFDIMLPSFAYMQSELEASLLDMVEVRKKFEKMGGSVNDIKANKILNDPIYKIILFQYYYLLRDYYKILFHLKQKHVADPTKFGPEYEKIRDLYVKKWTLALKTIESHG